ncbi:SpoIIE family protein phosphatase, partial [Anaerolineales bacterium HSG24]|nr:SpoIIE family protein phosphatase [Anaerolineales bacterium HSG24]
QALSGFEALELVEQGERFDLIILDIMMPRMSGYEVSRRLRERHAPEQVPVIMLTAKNQPADIVTGFEMGANDYLTKPVNKDELLARIKTLLKLKQAHQEQLKLTAIQHELSIAHDMQESLLPDPYPEWPDIEVVCYSIPAKDVGGDFYQYHQFETFEVFETSKVLAQKYAFAIGDVSGKGVSAALLMATSLSQFDASLALDFMPAERLAYLDKVISPYTKPRRQNCAMCYVELRIPRRGGFALKNEESPVGEAQFLIDVVNAGCIPPYIKRADADGSVEFDEKMGGFSLGQGLGAKHGYQAHTIELSPGDMVILTSDGVVEANNEAGDMLGFDRLMEIVRDFEPDTSFASQDLQGFKNLEGLNLDGAEAMLEHLKREVFAFTEGAEQHDDMTMVVVRV